MKKLVNVCQLEIHGDFTNIITVWQHFLSVVGNLTGVTVINSVKHDFPGGGFSGLILIAESHAAIHTWPELDKAWVELATCGDPISLIEFKNELLLMYDQSPQIETYL